MRILALVVALCFALAPVQAAKRKNISYNRTAKKRSAAAKRGQKRAMKRSVKRAGIRHN